MSNKLNSHALPTSREGGLQKSPSPLRNFVSHRAALPFIPAHDISRGIVHVTQTLLSFLFMLAVRYVLQFPRFAARRPGIPQTLTARIRTFQVGFILSIVVGLGVGETLFGRYSHHAAHLH